MADDVQVTVVNVVCNKLGLDDRWVAYHNYNTDTVEYVYLKQTKVSYIFHIGM